MDAPIVFFFPADAPLPLKSITADQRVVITLKNLPLHIWTATITEQMLSHCALEFLRSRNKVYG